jgi:cytoskeletal protein RodZ
MDIGAQLRTAREAKGLSIGTISQRTRVPARALSAIERNDRTALPPPAFSRGFVRTYAEEVDLDPESLVRDYFAQFPEQASAPPAIRIQRVPDASWQEPSRWGGMAAAVAILLAVVVTALVLGRRSEPGTELTPVGTTGDSSAPAAPAPAAPSIERPATPPAASTPPASPTRPLTVVLSMARPCWVAATVDGQRTIYRVLQGGETATLAGQSAIAIRFGDAGAVKWTINGRDPGTPGGDGAVRDIRINLENATTVR